MKILIYLFVAASLAACSSDVVEELAFRKTMEYQLKDDCGEDDVCIAAVENQIKECMEKSKWRDFIDRQDDEKALSEFIETFFPCFKDPDGNSYFKMGQQDEQNDEHSDEQNEDEGNVNEA